MAHHANGHRQILPEKRMADSLTIRLTIALLGKYADLAS